MFTIKYSKSDEFQFGVDATNFDKPAINLKEYSLLYGVYISDRSLALSLSGGVSYLSGINRGERIQGKHYKNRKIDAIGFPIELEVMIEFSKHVGIGVLYFGNVNNSKSYNGGMVRIKAGLF